MAHLEYKTPHGITVQRTSSSVPFADGLHDLLRTLDTQRGVYLSSGYEYPERYSRWDIASTAPALEIVGRGRDVVFQALNERGLVLLSILAEVLRDHPHWAHFQEQADRLQGHLKPLDGKFPEEQRSKQPSPYCVLLWRSSATRRIHDWA